MPEKIKSAWDGGQLQIEGLDEALSGERDGKVQVSFFGGWRFLDA
jgi:hypothetical protein